MSTDRLKVKLIGEDGNAFFILGRCRSAMIKAGSKPEEINQFLQEAKEGDYNHLLRTVQKYFIIE